MEFEIVGFRKGNDGKDLTVRKKNIFTRILIRKKQVMNKYCPEQFKILGISGRGNDVNFKTKIYTKEDADNYGDLNRGPTLAKNTKKKNLYCRIFIKNKHPEESECRERNIKEHVLNKAFDTSIAFKVLQKAM